MLRIIFLRLSAGCAAFLTHIAPGGSSQRRNRFVPMPPLSGSYCVYSYLQGSERAFESVYTDYAEGLYRCCRLRLFPKHREIGLSFRLFLFWGARNKGQGSIFFRLLTLPQYLCNFYVSSVITISEKISCFYFFCKSGRILPPYELNKLQFYESYFCIRTAV